MKWILLERAPMVDSHLLAVPEILATIPFGDPLNLRGDRVAVRSCTSMSRQWAGFRPGEVVPELVGNEVAVPRPMPSGW